MTDSAARWVATRNGEVVAEAETAKELFVILHEKQITGSITQKVPATAAGIPYEGTDCTPEEAVEAVKRYRRALRKIVDCPNPDSVENCHDRMWVIAQEALRD